MYNPFIKCLSPRSDPLEVAPQAGCSPLTLQKTMEKVVLLRKAVEQQRKQCEPSATLSCRLRQYAALLASQGSLDTAYSYIMQDQDVSVQGHLLYSEPLNRGQPLNKGQATHRYSTFFTSEKRTTSEQRTSCTPLPIVHFLPPRRGQPLNKEQVVLHYP